MRNILAALLTAALCLGLAACGPAPEPEPTPTPTPSVSPSPEAAEFALACYPEAGFHPEYLAGQPPFAVICFKNWSVLTQWSRIDGLTPAQQNIFHQFSDWKIT